METRNAAYKRASLEPVGSLLFSARRAMDYQRKKQLTQSVSYLQSVLVVSQDMMDLLKNKGVFTNEELLTIQVR